MSFGGPLEPRFAVLANRHNSFLENSITMPILRYSELASWGFYCLPLSPSNIMTVRCFYCGILFVVHPDHNRLFFNHTRGCIYSFIRSSNPIQQAVARLAINLTIESAHDNETTELARPSSPMPALLDSPSGSPPSSPPTEFSVPLHYHDEASSTIDATTDSSSGGRAYQRRNGISRPSRQSMVSSSLRIINNADNFINEMLNTISVDEESSNDEASTSSVPILIRGKHVIEPMFPLYKLYENRLATYEHWPPSIPITKYQMASAGFFYNNQNDSVTCYHCNSKRGRWLAHEDPWIVHARIQLESSDCTQDYCSHVFLVKGFSFIERARALTTTTTTTTNESVVAVAPTTSQTNENSDNAQCIICCAEASNMFFVPCGHLVSCFKCAIGRTKCFVCRQKIDVMHKAFFA